jgi:hypothetical protein
MAHAIREGCAARPRIMVEPLMNKLRLTCLLAFVLAPAAFLPAAEPTPIAAAASQRWPAVNVEFGGGTLGQLVALLNKSPDGSLNIVAEPGDLNATLPAFSVQNALPSSIVSALNQFLSPRGLTLVSSGVGVPAGMKDVYIVRHGPATLGNHDSFESMQLAPYLEHQKVDDIVGAIRAAWELDPAHEPNALRLKFHPPTSILIVSGPSEAIMVAQKVVGTLRRTADDYRSSPKPTAPPADKR